MTKPKTTAHKLSELASVDEVLFANRTPSKELEALRNEWTKKFEKRVKKL